MTDWSSLRLNVSRLRRQPTTAELKKRAQTASSIPIDATVVAKGLTITTSRIPEGSDVRVVGTADTTLTGIEVRATVSSSWEGECRRCLDLVTEPIELDLVTPFIPDHVADDDSDAYPITGDVVDVGEVVREELMLSLPLSPLCAEECEGADPERFASNERDQSDSADDEPEIDPRWAGLSALKFDDGD